MDPFGAVISIALIGALVCPWWLRPGRGFRYRVRVPARFIALIAQQHDHPEMYQPRPSAWTMLSSLVVTLVWPWWAFCSVAVAHTWIDMNEGVDGHDRECMHCGARTRSMPMSFDSVA